MDDMKFHKEFGQSAFRPKIYSPSFQPLLQSLLATLADIDFDYEKEREKLSRISPDTVSGTRALERLKARHRERREPYIRQLAALQQRMTELRA